MKASISSPFDVAPTDIIFGSMERELFRIKPDGEVILADGVGVDAAAVGFWNAVNLFRPRSEAAPSGDQRKHVQCVRCQGVINGVCRCSCGYGDPERGAEPGDVSVQPTSSAVGKLFGYVRRGAIDLMHADEGINAAVVHVNPPADSVPVYLSPEDSDLIPVKEPTT